MELAILCVPLFILMLGAMEVSYDMFVQQALNSAVETAARTVQVGTTQGVANETSQQLVAAVCPALSKLLSCANLTVAVEPVASGNDYYTSSVHNCLSYSGAANNKGGEVDTGTGGQMMVLGAWYNGPTFLGALVPKFAMSNGNGRLIHQTFSSVGFVNEYFGAGQGSGAIGGSGC
jgi:Flp pilus assembly protein TadG